MRVSPPKPDRNLFDVFSAGKEFFFIRTLLEVLAFLGMMMGCIVLFYQSVHVMPLIVRDAKGNLYLGRPTVYSPTLTEIMNSSKTLLEAVFMRSDVELSKTPYLNEFVSPGLYNSLQGLGRPNVARVARVTGLFVSSAWSSPAGSGMVIYAQVELVRINTSDAPYNVGYYQVTYVQSPRTEHNPTGWRIDTIHEISHPAYIEERTRVLGSDLVPREESQAIDIKKDL